MQIIKRHIWKCGYCEDVVVSYSNDRHNMQWCKCGKTAVDLEEYYIRTCGKPESISVKKYDDKEEDWVSCE